MRRTTTHGDPVVGGGWGVPPRRSRHRRARRQPRRRLGATLALVVVVVAVLVAGGLIAHGGGSSGTRSDRGDPRFPTSAHRPTAPAALHRPTPPPTSSTVATTTTTDPGSLPQTAVLPSASTPQFETEMSALWQGVVSGAEAPAMPAFFPESAYLQLKAISDPGYDYTSRLQADFAADIDAAHAILGTGASTATLLEVHVPEEYGHWVPPRVCDNSVGYYEVANSRVVYVEDGQTRSFGIASMISWRGVWYVVHLGAILRSSAQGVVDDPEPGTGTSADSSTC